VIIGHRVVAFVGLALRVNEVREIICGTEAHNVLIVDSYSLCKPCWFIYSLCGQFVYVPDSYIIFDRFIITFGFFLFLVILIFLALGFFVFLEEENCFFVAE
jgi:hypothetical protein